jgi:integrase
MALLCRLESILPASGRIFPISYQRLYQIWDHWKPCKKKLHSLRHTFAIELYRRTRDLRLVQMALGHKSINNTMVYADYIYTQEELKKLLITA